MRNTFMPERVDGVALAVPVSVALRAGPALAAAGQVGRVSPGCASSCRCPRWAAGRVIRRTAEAWSV